MEEITLTGQSISAFREFLVENEKARATVEKYVQEAEQLRLALCGAPVTKAGVLAYRERLQQQYRALTVNNKLSAVNAYLRFCGAEHCEVKLLKVQRRYARAQDIQEGPLFRTRTGRPLDRSNIWHEMKTLCREAGVMPEKVFPHNLRHLFAKCFYEQEKDLAHLADLLGHSSIETTRIYVAVSARAHEQILEKMRLIV